MSATIQSMSEPGSLDGRRREAIHGLRNVLNTSTMNAHLARLLEHDTQRRQACLDLIIEECAKGSRLLQQLSELDEALAADARQRA